jgi:hypothetical protein
LGLWLLEVAALVVDRRQKLEEADQQIAVQAAGVAAVQILEQLKDPAGVAQLGDLLMQ